MSLNEIVLFGFYIAIFIMTIVIHEVSHGLAAFKLGDSTAKYAGRLTMNPLKHLDLMGSLIFPLLLLFLSGFRFTFGWAKPVPYNPYNLKDQKWGPAIVGAAGPLSNIAAALVFGIAARLIFVDSGVRFAISRVFLNFGTFSLTDLANILSQGQSLGAVFVVIFSLICLINLFLAFFNLIPIPPLDGSKLLYAIIPLKDRTKIMLEQFGFIFVILLVFFFGVGALAFQLALNLTRFIIF